MVKKAPRYLLEEILDSEVILNLDSDITSVKDHPLSEETPDHEETSSNKFDFDKGDFVSNSQDSQQIPSQIVDTKQKELEPEVDDDQVTDKLPLKIHKIDKFIKPQKKRIHLQGKRRKKGFQNKFKSSLQGYWTKNFLPNAKVPHFSFIEKKKGPKFIDSYPELVEIRTKVGITMDDYLKMYKLVDLKEVWQQFFKRKVLYRELMTSRTEGKYRLVFVRFLQKFEEAFRTGIFIGISRKIDKMPSNINFHKTKKCFGNIIRRSN